MIGNAGGAPRPPASQEASLELEYSIDEGDLIAFTVYRADHSESTRQAREVQRWFFTVALGAFAVLLMLVGAHPLVSGAFLAGAALWSLFSPRYVKSRYIARATEMWREGAHWADLGPQRVAADEDGLHWASPLQESRLKWLAVERIESGPDHTFIFTGAASGIIVPRRSVSKGSYEDFVAAIHEYHRQAMSRTSAEKP